MTKTILIVDDSSAEIELMKFALDVSGHDVRSAVAMSGDSALGILSNGAEKPALIMLDLKMPGMSGIDTLKKIRAEAELSTIPVVVVTSSSLKSDETDAYGAGANGYLHKSVDLNQFKKDIKTLLDRWIPNKHERG